MKECELCSVQVFICEGCHFMVRASADHDIFEVISHMRGQEAANEFEGAVKGKLEEMVEHIDNDDLPKAFFKAMGLGDMKFNTVKIDMAEMEKQLHENY